LASAPAHFRRHFLPWDRTLPAQAAAFLAEGWSGEGPLDLSRLLVVVPTRQAGRRLREALAEKAAERGQAVFSPRVLTPEALVAAPPGAAATRLESILAWVAVLQSADLEACREVFPVDPPARSFGWALRVAEELLRVQSSLAEAGLRLGGVAGKAGEDCPELGRWRQLAALEQGYDERLAALGRRDAQEARIAAAAEPAAMAGVDRMVLVGTPDPWPPVLTALAAHEGRIPVDVVVFAPEAEAAAFDEWGRPLAAAWQDRPPVLPEFERRVRLCADPPAQAEEIAALARAYGDPDGRLGVGTADGEVLAALESALRRAGLAVFNPEGRPRRREELGPLLASLAALAREPDYATVEALARCPAVLDFLGARDPGGFSAARWLAGLDELRRRRLPADLGAARAGAAGMEGYPELGPSLEALDGLREVLGTGDFTERASAALRRIFAARTLDPASEADARLAESAAAWAEVVRACASAPLAPADAWELALRHWGEGAAASEKPAGAVELQGWLELLWEDAPHLVVAGMNDGCVPEAVAGDPFLPESLRERLGLRTNAARFARDAYLLQALAACRVKAGRLDLLLGKFSAAGDPRRPSRLLLRCADAELPARVDFLFRPVAPAQPRPAWKRAWRLAPPRLDPPSRVAVTALRDWLACPFRFYLRHVLGMAPVDRGKSELDDLDFGTLCHGVLEAMGRDPAMRDCTEAGMLRDFLVAELDRRIGAQYGENLGLPLVIQREAARQRLGQAAKVQARERAAGWRIAEVERPVARGIAGLAVRGKIDRIDRQEGTGAVRVLDYKTSDQPRTPAEAHLRPLRRGEEPAPWARCEAGGRPRAWSDLQLPFYRIALADEYPGGIGCGYFNLPKAAGETGIAIWEDYPPELHAAAAACAAGVCGAIARGEFWPPREGVDPEFDDFAALFHRGAAASVAWEEGPR
jgi:ATP-dependent helicase/nuclease subunit B